MSADDVAEIVAAWHEKARGDLAAAQLCLGAPHIPGWIVGFHLQQSVEKWLKAELVALGVEPPRVHDLIRLLEQVEAAGGTSLISEQLAADWYRTSAFSCGFRCHRLQRNRPHFGIGPRSAAGALKLARPPRQLRILRRQLGK